MNLNYILFDDFRRINLLPLTFTRPVAEIRIGILTIKEKWEKMLESSCSYHTVDYLAEKYPVAFTSTDSCFINGGILPNKDLVRRISELKSGEAIARNSVLLAGILAIKQDINHIPSLSDFKKVYDYIDPIVEVLNPWDIFSQNGVALQNDFDLMTQNRKSEKISETNKVLNPARVFVEPGAKIECCILNAETGPIYIGKDALIMEGSIIRGSFAACEGSVVKLGAKIYGPTTIGPFSKVGGELNNCVIFANSNKAHDGFLGNAVLGEWCNLGADTNNSNLKNNYAEVKLWNYQKKGFINTGLQFCGLIMGDHSKCGINTMFNTGTVVGVSANIFGAGFPRNFVPSFSWGGAQGFTVYQLPRAYETIEKVLQRRNLILTEVDKRILQKVFEFTEEFRNFS